MTATKWLNIYHSNNCYFIRGCALLSTWLWCTWDRIGICWCVCGADVLALASALCMLGVSLRTVRTALWCALQLTCADLPVPCIRRAWHMASRHLALPLHHGRTRSHAAAGGGAGMEFWEHGDDVFSDGDEIPEEDETRDNWTQPADDVLISQFNICREDLRQEVFLWLCNSNNSTAVGYFAVLF